MTGPTFKKLQAACDEASETFQAFNQDAKARAAAKFKADGGCDSCRGRGWIVTWDTLDCMRGSYHESRECPEEVCTADTRQVSGLAPFNSKYDRYHGNSTWEMPSADQVELNRLSEVFDQALQALKEEEHRWSVAKGKLVKVVRSGGGRKKFRTPVDTEGLVVRVFVNDYGTEKAVIVTQEGEKFFPTVNQLNVIDPDPDTSVWDELKAKEIQKDGIPVFMRVKRIGKKAALVIVLGSQVPTWLPLSMVPDLKDAQVGKMVSVLVPAWLAKDKGFDVAGPSSS